MERGKKQRNTMSDNTTPMCTAQILSAVNGHGAACIVADNTSDKAVTQQRNVAFKGVAPDFRIWTLPTSTQLLTASTISQSFNETVTIVAQSNKGTILVLTVAWERNRVVYVENAPSRIHPALFVTVIPAESSLYVSYDHQMSPTGAMSGGNPLTQGPQQAMLPFGNASPVHYLHEIDLSSSAAAVWHRVRITSLPAGLVVSGSSATSTGTLEDDILLFKVSVENTPPNAGVPLLGSLNVGGGENAVPREWARASVALTITLSACSVLAASVAAYAFFSRDSAPTTTKSTPPPPRGR